MAMLAEPRRRKRYNLCPRGKALYEDDSRFGTKMLEKMGWSKGRGLGANEDGAQEFVRVRFKNDAEGLGFEARDDQWTVHEEGFNGLLKALNGGEQAEPAANGADSGSEEETRPMGFGFKAAPAVEQVKAKSLKEKISGVSLEEKSKYSKARVHYKKFTRGKDLAQYSEKDLANIFGKKTTDELSAPIEVAPPEPVEEEKPLNPNFGGVQTVSTGLSVNDYFRLKMEAMKNKLKHNAAQPEQPGAEEQAAEAAEEPTAKKKKKKKDKPEEQEEQEPAAESKKKKKSKRAAEQEQPEEPAQEEAANPPKRKKKRQEAEELVVTEEATLPAEQTPSEPKKQKKSKKTEETAAEAAEEAPAQKKKSKKTEETAAVEEAPVEAAEEQLEEAEKATKKKSKKSKSEAQLEAELPEATEKRSKKKSKKNKETPVELQDAQLEPAKKSKKSKKGNESPAEASEEPQLQPAETEKKSKKKSRKNKQAGEEHAEEAKQTKESAVEPVARKSSKKSKRNQVVESEANGAAQKKLKNSEQLQPAEVSAAADDDDDDSDSSWDAVAERKAYLSHEELLAKLDSFNVYTISSFCAEKFHIVDMKRYRNSTLSQIPGYLIDENIQLRVEEAKNDASRIMSLWESRSNKYRHHDQSSTSWQSSKHFKRITPTALRAIRRTQAFTAI
ncbi:hypothetical protein KR222_009920 [Zaprionus bogoriensis]|nr:hypothetical protein KR222_009920 [Zaprionus bogoriensis]